MINQSEALENIGRRVVYTPYGGDTEEGVIAGVTGRRILVRYGTDAQSKATAPAALDFADGAS